MPTLPIVVTPELREAARHTLYFFTATGAKGGSFSEHLIAAMAHADLINLAKFYAAFPEYTICVWQAKHVADGIEQLREWAR